MTWWRRRHPDGGSADAALAGEEARAQLSQARAQAAKVYAAERSARILARQVDALARDVERTLQRRHA